MTKTIMDTVSDLKTTALKLQAIAQAAEDATAEAKDDAIFLAMIVTDYTRELNDRLDAIEELADAESALAQM